MKIIEFGTEYKTPLAVALGFFDCIHNGHSLLVRTAKEYARENADVGVKSALFTFCNDPSQVLGGEKQIYDFKERSVSLEKLGLDTLVYTRFDNKFASIEPVRFLKNLTEKLNIRAIITGKDYTFGKEAKGNIVLLRNYCSEHQIDLIVKPFEVVDGKKISTSSMKNLVENGEIQKLNMLLSEPYFMLGEVVHARHVGTELGFPTANIKISDSKLKLASGVYSTVLSVDGKQYMSMTNVGAKPTFDIENFSIEAFILDFNGDLYGKTVKLSFISRMRDIVRFSSAQELKNQLIRDEQSVRKIIKL